MASVNQIVSEIVHSLGEPNNHALRRNVRELIYQERNEQIRRSYERHKYLDKIFNQLFKLSLVSLPADDILAGLQVKESCKRSATRVPRPVVLPNNLPFTNVTVDYVYHPAAIPFVPMAVAGTYEALPGMKQQLRYDYINGYLYLFCENLEKLNVLNSIYVESPFERPEVIEQINNPEYDTWTTDDNEFLLPEAMIPYIKENIYKRDLLGLKVKNNSLTTTDDKELTTE